MRTILSIKMLFRSPIKTGQEDYCVIVVTHDLEVAEMADSVMKMRDGELILASTN